MSPEHHCFPVPVHLFIANSAVSNKSVNEQYESSGSYPSIVRSNDLVVTIAIADYRCTSTQSIANMPGNSATKTGPSQAGKRLVCSIPAMRFVRTQSQKREL
jgi:hypothetical protein